MAKKKQNARTKYLRDYDRFLKRIETAELRGFIVPEDIKNIKKVKGFYAQASARLKRYDLQTIERQSTFKGMSGAKALNLARAEQKRSGRNLEASLKFVAQLADLREELEQLYKDTFEAGFTPTEGLPAPVPVPSKPIEIGMTAEEVYAIAKKDIDSAVADEESVLQQIDNEITRLIYSFKNYPLQKQVMDKYVRALDQGRDQLLSKLMSNKEEVIEELQKVAEEEYNPETASGDDEWFGQSEFGVWWTNVLDK